MHLILESKVSYPKTSHCCEDFHIFKILYCLVYKVRITSYEFQENCNYGPLGAEPDLFCFGPLILGPLGSYNITLTFNYFAVK